VKAASITIGPYALMTQERVLLLGSDPVAIAPKAVDVLFVLAADAGRVVSKAELMERVWPQTFVDEANLTQNIYVLRRRFERDGAGLRIETVPKRGYRLIVPAQMPSPRALEAGASRRGGVLRTAAACAAILVGCTVSGSSWQGAGGVGGGSPDALPNVALRDYLLGREYQVGGTRAALQRAASRFSAVVIAAPGNALGYAGRAETEASLAYYAPDASSRITLQALAIADARNALECGNNAADANAAFGAVEMSVEHDDAAAEAAFARALAVNPNHLGALVWSGTLLMQQGRIGSARRAFARAVAIAPNAAGTVASLAWSDFLSGDNPDAIALSRQMLLAHQLPVVARVTLANAYLAVRDYRRARMVIRDLSGAAQTHVQAIALAARLDALTGRVAPGRRQLGGIEARTDPRSIGGWDAESIAAAYLALGDRSRAYLWLARIALWYRRQTAHDPRFASLVGEPRFEEWTRNG
jgi:DNA-binding winged helix-turn-helix (wHTH) protein/Tfp pilus assembly protein PilF